MFDSGFINGVPPHLNEIYTEGFLAKYKGTQSHAVVGMHRILYILQIPRFPKKQSYQGEG
jgi:hypothetical protein